MMSKPRLFAITLHLARNSEFPEGSSEHGYSFVAPLGPDRALDSDAWRAHPEACTARRFWKGEETRHGRLVHRPGGWKGSTWGFDYDAETRADDEAGFRLGDHRFNEGEYVSIQDPDRQVRTFRVAKVERA